MTQQLSTGTQHVMVLEPGRAERLRIVIPARKIARRMGLGKLKLRLTTAFSGDIRAKIEAYQKRKMLLPRILNAKPIAAGHGNIELRMLLHKARFLEGAWALYSFLRFACIPIRVVVHSDGSLDTGSADMLRRIFVGCTVLDRATADLQVLERLNKNGLDLCAELRKRLILALKLLDFYCLGEASTYIVLDSDVLTFQHPQELVEAKSLGATTPHIFSQDNNDQSYPLPADVLQGRAKTVVLKRLNSGLLRIERSGLDLHDIEDCLRETNLLTDPQSILRYVEQGVYACCLARHGAVGLHPDRYTICGDPREVVTGHYCGGGYWASRFYREGVPYLVHKFGLDL
jgi:hypothetical protein